MKTIVAIGGGSIAEKSTLEIDKYIISLANKEKPNVLFVPTASIDAQGYIDTFINYYESLGCVVDVLRLSTTDDDNIIKSKIFSSDIIYIGGGNTARMMRIFKRTKVNEYIKLAYEQGIILAGLSAGAMAFFKSGYSDSNRSTNPNASLCLVKCLDIIPYCFCPHYNDPDRKSFDFWVVNKNFDGIALCDDAALIYIDDKIKGIIKTDSNAKCFNINALGKSEII